MKSLHFFATALVGASLALAACGVDQAARPPEAQSLFDVDIPADLTFATSKPVALTVSASAEALGGEWGRLEVRDAEGRVVLEFPILAGRPFEFPLTVAAHHDHLEVEIGGQTIDADITDGAARVQR